VRASPSVLLLPLILFAFCVIGGVIAVRYAAQSYADAERSKATTLVNAASTVSSRRWRASPTALCVAPTPRAAQRRAAACALEASCNAAALTFARP